MAGLQYDTYAMKMWEKQARKPVEKTADRIQYERHLLGCALPCEPQGRSPLAVLVGYIWSISGASVQYILRKGGRDMQ